MAEQVTIHQTDGRFIELTGDVNMADGVLHVTVTGATKRVRRGRQWFDESQPDRVHSFPLVHVLRYVTEAVEEPAADR